MSDSSSRTVRIDSVALWTPALPDWTAARDAFGRAAGADDPPQQQAATADAAAQTQPATKPRATLLAANERRRAPDSVLMGLEVALAAATAAGRAPAALASVFVSAHGDLAITDALCRTLADAPQLLSPTRFHHAVHNAVSGYWAIGSGSHAASTALSAHAFSFGAGLMEALSQCAADAQPVLLVACDTAACGPLASVNGSRGWLAVALVIAPVLAPEIGPLGDSPVTDSTVTDSPGTDSPVTSSPGTGSPAAGRQLTWSLLAGSNTTPLRSAAAQALAANAMAGALPLCEALAHDAAATVRMPLSDHLSLDLRLAAA